MKNSNAENLSLGGKKEKKHPAPWSPALLLEEEWFIPKGPFSVLWSGEGPICPLVFTAATAVLTTFI